MEGTFRLNMEPTKKKRLCSYNKLWEAKKPWIKPVSDDSKAYCTVCRREFSISHGGENDVVRHASSEMHKKAMLAKGASNIGAYFATSTGTTADDNRETVYLNVIQLINVNGRFG